MRNLKHVEAEDLYLSHDDPYIDFSSAGLYLVGLQTTVATVGCAATSVASCWLLPVAAISAVRTLALTSAVGVLWMRKPIKIGKVRGVLTIFNALRPCVVFYILALVLEQLVHTCVAEDMGRSGYTRHVVFHSMMAIVALSGFVRAWRPSSSTDAPFLITALALLVVAMLPPPAAPLSGPLCEGASLFSAGERLLRAFLFSALYVTHAYCHPPARNSIHDLTVCIARCSTAAVWVLGCHLFIVWLGALQAFVALWSRFGQEPSPQPLHYDRVETRSDSGLSDAELGIPPPPILSSGALVLDQTGDNGYGSEMIHRVPTPDISSSATGAPEGVPVEASTLVNAVYFAKMTQSSGGVTKARMAEIANQL